MGNSHTPSGMITPTAPIITSFPAMRGTSAGAAARAAAARNKKNKYNSPDALYRQSFDYEMLNSEFNTMKMQAASQLSNLAKDKYHGDQTAFINSPEVQKIVSGLQYKSASLIATRNAIETEKKEFIKEASDAANKYALNDFAVDADGRRLYIENGKLQKESSKDKTKDDVPTYLTVGQYYEDVPLLLEIETSGAISVPQKYERLQHIDHRSSPLNTELLTWANYAKSGYIDNSSEVPVDSPYKSFIALRKKGSKSNFDNLFKMTNTLISGLGIEATAELKQEYWKSGWENANIYRTFQWGVDDKGNEVIIKDKNGKPKYHLESLSESYLNELKSKEGKTNKEFYYSMFTTDPKDKTVRKFNKFSVEGRPLTENEKFDSFVYNYISDKVMPGLQEKDNSGLAFRKKADAEVESQIDRRNFWGTQIALLKAQAAVDEEGYESNILRRNNDINYQGEELDDPMSYSKEAYMSFDRDIDPLHMTRVMEMNDELSERIINDDGKLDQSLFDAEVSKGGLEQYTSVAVSGGIVLPNKVIKNSSLLRYGKKIRLLPSTIRNNTTGEYDYKKKGDAQAYIEAFIVVDKDIATNILSKTLVSQNTRNDETSASLTDIKADMEIDTNAPGLNLTKEARDFGMTELDADNMNYDYVVVPVWIPLTGSVEATFGAHGDEANVNNKNIVNTMSDPATIAKKEAEEATKIIEAAGNEINNKSN